MAPGAVAGTKGTTYLGRSWGDYARVVFQNSDLGNIITAAGWDSKSILLASSGPRVNEEQL